MSEAQRSAAIRDRLRINGRIRAREVRLIDEDGGQVGIIGIREALTLAEERGLDLVEVAPNAIPPVCRLMDYGKFRYEQTKKEREARRNQKQAEIKEVRLRPKTDDHDLEVKSNQARRFLTGGDKVKFTVRFRGREMAHPDIGREMLEQLAEGLRDLAVVEQKPLLEGKALSLVLAPNPRALKLAQQARVERARQATEQQATRQAVAAPAAGGAVEAVEPEEPDELDDVDDDDEFDGDEDEE